MEELLQACVALGMTVDHVKASASKDDSSVSDVTRQRLQKMVCSQEAEAPPSPERGVDARNICLSCDEFCDVVESALRTCGIQAKKQWKKVALLHKLKSSQTLGSAPPAEHHHGGQQEDSDIEDEGGIAVV